MAYDPNDRCRRAGCGLPIEWVFCPAKGRTIPLDPTNVPRAGDPLATYATYPDPHTGATVVRKVARDEHLDPDSDELVRPHWNTCKAITRNDHDK